MPLLRLFVPQILFYGLIALGTAILNARRRFAAPAFAPILNNVVVCGVLLLLRRASPGRGAVGRRRSSTIPSWLWLLGAGTTAGIALMTIALWPSLRASGWRYRWRFRPRDRGGAQGRRAVGLDARLRHRQPDRAARRARAGGSRRRGRPDLLSVRVPVLPAALRTVRRVADDDDHAGAGVGGQQRRHACASASGCRTASG